MKQNVLSIGVYAAADPDGIALSQTPAAGGVQSLTLNGAFVTGGVATLDTPRQVAITSAADDSGRFFLIKGARADDVVIVESIAGAAIGVASTVQAFKTVTSIQVDDDTAGAVEAGTVTVVSTSWFPTDYIRNPVNVGLSLIIGGATADITVELTRTNLLNRRGNDPLPTVGHHVGSEFALIYPVVNAFDSSIANAVADAQALIVDPITALRMTSNAIITGNDVDLEFVQAGHRGA